jgi:hypothetical protein
LLGNVGWGSHSGNYECCHLLGHSTVCELMFWGNWWYMWTDVLGQRCQLVICVNWCFRATGDTLHSGFLSSLFSILKMEVMRSSETLVHIQTTQLYLPEDGKILKNTYKIIFLQINFVNVRLNMCFKTKSMKYLSTNAALHCHNTFLFTAVY